MSHTTRPMPMACVLIFVPMCVSLTGGAVLICLLHGSTDAACRSITAVHDSMYRCTTDTFGTHMRGYVVCVCNDPLSLDRQIEDLSSQFAHVSCQSAGEAPPIYPPSQGYIYAAPPPPNPPSYCQPSPAVRIHMHFIYFILWSFKMHQIYCVKKKIYIYIYILHRA